MSVGRAPNPDGWLFIPPVQCTSCTRGSSVQDGVPSEPDQFNLPVANGADGSDDAARSGVQPADALPS
jgi:hypothetical protein